MLHKDNIAEALWRILENASEQDLSRLGLAMQKFECMAPRSYQGVQKQPFAAAIVGTIEDVIGFHNEMSIIDAE